MAASRSGSGNRTSRTKSPYFQPPSSTSSSSPSSCLPFPPLNASSFGLIQERLAHDPFRLLIATIFLNRTRGTAAIPLLYQVFARYPTVHALADANLSDLVAMIHPLGFQNARAKKLIALAQLWLVSPPCAGTRFRRLNYPSKTNGRDIKAGEAIDDADPRVAWEIAHLPGLGTYAIDSWRIFCRDVLRGLASDWNGADTKEDDGGRKEGDETGREENDGCSFSPEWKRVQPQDKELRAYLAWMWLKEGWIWNMKTGERTPLAANKKIRRVARRGGLFVPQDDGTWILVPMHAKPV